MEQEGEEKGLSKRSMDPLYAGQQGSQSALPWEHTVSKDEHSLRMASGLAPRAIK